MVQAKKGRGMGPLPGLLIYTWILKKANNVRPILPAGAVLLRSFIFLNTPCFLKKYRRIQDVKLLPLVGISTRFAAVPKLWQEWPEYFIRTM
ncbi:MAG: hypothetical protein C0613_05550 [Desulfobulbaceae bacterium]|nr:MAG: hypothetical protein C0613_05550 [Desulfobulbaceae bacterium]